MSAWLRQRGFDVYTFNLTPNNGDAPLEDLAAQLHAFIDSRLGALQLLDIVAFSMGGLVARYYLQHLGGIERVTRFIAISSPNHGTRTAYLRNNPGARQMRPDSAFLADLNRDVTALSRIRVTTLWTPFDLMILPATSSTHLPGRSVRVSVLLHPLMLFDPRVLKLVHQALTEPAA